MKLSLFISLLLLVVFTSVSCKEDIIAGDPPTNPTDTTGTADTTIVKNIMDTITYSGIVAFDHYYRSYPNPYVYTGPSQQSMDFPIVVSKRDSNFAYFYLPPMPPEGVQLVAHFYNNVAERKYSWTHPIGTSYLYLHIRAEFTRNGLYIIKNEVRLSSGRRDSLHYEGYLRH